MWATRMDAFQQSDTPTVFAIFELQPTLIPYRLLARPRTAASRRVRRRWRVGDAVVARQQARVTGSAVTRGRWRRNNLKILGQMVVFCANLHMTKT